MPATGATHLIFFIAAMIIASALVGGFYVVIDNLNEGMIERSDAEQRSIRSRVEIINDLVAMPYNNTSKELTVYVKNTGVQRLDPNQTVVFIDGLDHNYTWSLVGGAGNWTQGETLELVVEDCYFTAFSDHSVKVSASYGASDRKNFRIGALP
jgi:archaellum component FlaG (FlaF/FlaG flagellin family)